LRKCEILPLKTQQPFSSILKKTKSPFGKSLPNKNIDCEVIHLLYNVNSYTKYLEHLHPNHLFGLQPMFITSLFFQLTKLCQEQKLKPNFRKQRFLRLLITIGKQKQAKITRFLHLVSISSPKHKRMIKDLLFIPSL